MATAVTKSTQHNHVNGKLKNLIICICHNKHDVNFVPETQDHKVDTEKKPRHFERVKFTHIPACVPSK